MTTVVVTLASKVRCIATAIETLTFGFVNMRKIQGHKVSVSVSNGTVHMSKLIKAQDVDLCVTESGTYPF